MYANSKCERPCERGRKCACRNLQSIISILLVLLLQIVNVRRPYVRGRKGACRNLQVMEPYPETLLWFCIAMHFEPAAVTFLFYHNCSFLSYCLCDLFLGFFWIPVFLYSRIFAMSWKLILGDKCGPGTRIWPDRHLNPIEAQRCPINLTTWTIFQFGHSLDSALRVDKSYMVEPKCLMTKQVLRRGGWTICFGRHLKTGPWSYGCFSTVPEQP